MFVPPADPCPPLGSGQRSLPIIAPLSLSKRSPLGSIAPQSSDSPENGRGELESAVEGEDGKAPVAKRRSVSFTKLKGAIEAAHKKAGTISLKKDKSGESRSSSSSPVPEGEDGQERARPPTLALPDVLPSADDWLGTDSDGFADSLEQAFNRLTVSHIPRSTSPDPPSVLSAGSQAPPSPSYTTVTASQASVYHSCNSSFLSFPSVVASTEAQPATSTAARCELACGQADRAVSPLHLVPDAHPAAVHLHGQSSMTQQQLDDAERRAAFRATLQALGEDPDAYGEPVSRDSPHFDPRADDALDAHLRKISRMNSGYGERQGEIGAQDDSPKSTTTASTSTAGPSPPFAIGDNPLTVAKKLVERGTLRRSVLDGWTASEARELRAVASGAMPSPFALVKPAARQNDSRPASPGSPTAAYSDKSGWPLKSLEPREQARAPSSLRFGSYRSADWVEDESAAQTSLNSSVASAWSQPSPVKPSQFTQLRSSRRDDDDSEDSETQQEDNKNDSPPRSLPWMDTTPIPTGLRYVAASAPSPRLQDKYDGMPMSPPPSADLLADVGSSPFGPFAYDRGGPPSPDGDDKVGWYFRRGPSDASKYRSRFDDVESEANTSGGYHPDGEDVSFISSAEDEGHNEADAATLEPLAHSTPVAESAMLSRMFEGFSLSATQGADDSPMGASSQFSDADTDPEDPHTPTRRVFVRSPDAPSPSPGLFAGVRSFPGGGFPAPASPISPIVNTQATDSSLAATVRIRRPLPPIPQSASAIVPAATPRIQLRGQTPRPRSMHERLQTHEVATPEQPPMHEDRVKRPPVTSLPPGADPSAVVFNPHALSPIAGSPASNLDPGSATRTSRRVVPGNGSPSPLATVAFGAQRGRGPSASGRVQVVEVAPTAREEEKDLMEQVRSELEAGMRHRKGFDQRRVEVAAERQKSLRRTVKRRSLVEEAGDSLPWPAVARGSWEARETVAVTGDPSAFRTLRLSGTYLRRIEPSESSKSYLPALSPYHASDAALPSPPLIKPPLSYSTDVAPSLPPSSPTKSRSLKLKARSSATSLRTRTSPHPPSPSRLPPLSSTYLPPSHPL